MSVTRVLLDILVVLVAAKLAAEGSERLGVPAVVGEIVAGVVVGPSALHLVGANDVLKVLGELGVILLLLDVGLEMDLGELAAVGRAALSVATIGVVVPFAAGWGAALGLGMAGKAAIFVGAALTATSVGITARVFGDLRALATIEARTVLGAAVADDVMGLVILTVVTRLVSQGSVSINSVVGIVAVAVGFLAVASLVGIRFAPWTFHQLNRLSRSNGTLIALSLAFTLGVAELADKAKLAPIVGAFVAGLALSRSSLAPRIRRELTPVGHLLIPIFFVQIGLDAQIGQFARPRVLGVAAVLLGIAVVGKLVAAAGMWRSPGDRLLVGLGMIPRGEVGLIFATLGLSQGIIGRDVYASLLLVVLATTLMTPSLLKWRVRQKERRQVESDQPPIEAPAGGWITVEHTPRGQTVELAAGNPPGSAGLAGGLDAAQAIARGARAGERLVAWLTTLPDDTVAWDPQTVAVFDELMRVNDPHAWRFLLVTGVLDRQLPEIAATLRFRRDDPFETDPTRTLSWPRLERLMRSGSVGPADRNVRLAALALDAAELTPNIDDAADLVRRVARRMDLGDEAEHELSRLVSSAELLPSAAIRLDGLDEEPILHLASHLGTTDAARAAFTLAAASLFDEGDSGLRMSELRDLVLATLAHPELSGVGASGIIDQRRAQATALIPSAAARIAATPSPFLLSQEPADVARQAALIDPPLARRCVRVAVTPVGDGSWRLDVAVPDEVGLLAHQLALLSERGYDVVDFATVVWPDKQSLSTFRVRADARPHGDALADDIAASIPSPVSPLVLRGADIRFDSASSPWHTVCTIRTDDRGRALLAAAKAFALAQVNVVAARATLIDGAPVEVLELVDKRGGPINHAAQDRVLAILATGAVPSLRRRTGGR
jgi:Kef-type K+ transport system membrane component KefB